MAPLVQPLRLWDRWHRADATWPPPPKKEIACTRSFGITLTDLPDLIEAVSSYASRAAEKLRAQGSHTCKVLTFVHTSPFRPGPRFDKSIVTPLRRPTSETSALVDASLSGLRAIYKPGFPLVKAGVICSTCSPQRGSRTNSSSICQKRTKAA